jgi:ribosomal protein L12E/L44/L45/RPP1/RPP2
MNQQGTATATEETAIEPARKVRAELNLEQWSIWQPAKSKNDPKPRVLTKEITLDNGDKITAQVEISVTARGALTTEDQRTYYALIKYHDENGRADDTTYFSLRQLSKILGKGWGTRASETITDSLARLYGTSFLWVHSYRDATTGKTSESLEGFRILEKLKVVRTKQDGHTTRAEGYFRFNDAILANLRKNHTKPVLLDVVLSFKSEVAQIIYTQLDRILSRDITSYEKRTKELFADLGLEGKEYAYQSARKRILEKAIAELENAPLSNGATLASVRLEKTADGKDYKLVAKRGRAKPKNAPAAPRSSESQENPHSKEERPPESRTEAKNEGREAKQKGSELIAYFQQVFFGAEKLTTQPGKKHRDLADSIVASHGEAVSRYIVDFAKAEAEKSKYPIATFGAIANYVDRAVASYTMHQAGLKRREQLQRAEAKKHEEQRAYRDRSELGFKLYNDLPEAERIELTNHYQATLATSDEWRDKDFTDSLQRKIFESSVKSEVREHLLSRHEAEQ